MTGEMKEKVQIFMKKHHMIEEGDRILVGVSGGADSVCLLLLLNDLKKEMEFSLLAAHVEHGIRGEESIADAVFSKKLCERLGIPFQLCQVNVPEYAGRTHQTLEEAARELRYDCFEKICRSQRIKKIAVAHHGNDCAETMLFHLARGSGIRGLAGIAPIRQEDGISVIRPLLCLTRQEIEEWLRACGQTFCVDDTNGNLIYSRNRIRQQIIPELSIINSRAVCHMEKTAEQLREICEYLDQAADQAAGQVCSIQYGTEENMENCLKKPVKICLNRETFLQLHSVIQHNLLHRMLGKISGSRKDITSSHVAMVRELFSYGVGKKVSLPYKITARATYEGVELYLEDGQMKERPGLDFLKYDLVIPGEVGLKNGWIIQTEIRGFEGDLEKIPKKTYTKWFDYDKIKSNVQLRTPCEGDFFQTNEAGGHKKLNRYFIDEKIPAEQRNQMLLLADESHVLWVIGYRTSEAYKVTEKTRQVLCVQCKINGGNHGREN